MDNTPPRHYAPLRTTGPGWSELRAEGERGDRLVGFIASVEGVLLVLVGETAPITVRGMGGAGVGRKIRCRITKRLFPILAGRVRTKNKKRHQASRETASMLLPSGSSTKAA